MSPVAGTELESHVILTGPDGVLRTPPDKVDAMVRTMAQKGKGVLHFHGGLVSEDSGLGIGRDLLPVYSKAGAYPIFVIWRSDVVAIVRGNLGEIAREEVFKRLVKKVLRYAAGKAGEELTSVGKGVGMTPANPLMVDTELARLEDDRLPFEDLVPGKDVPPLTDEEIADFEDDVGNDEALGAAVAGAVAAVEKTAAEEAVAKGADLPVPLRGSLIDREAAAELRVDAEGKALITTVAIVRKATRTLTAVIGRFRSGRDHGVYATVVEEVLREFYVGNAGASLWATMKLETADTFVKDDPPRGGQRILAALAAALADGATPEITLVGHSTGAVYINNLLGAVDALRTRPEPEFPPDFTFRNVAFLAPACTFADFDRVVRLRKHLWERFRMFTMTDANERADRLVPALYPHSLLYFVSGLLERDATGAGEGGKPLVGLQRWFERTAREDDPPELEQIADLIREAENNVVWSPVDGPPGCSSGARSHGAFDDDPKVQESLRVLISGDP